ncbi:MAG: hypothetical protein AAB131_08000 [Actinomycetota bacterium]|jgi:hypothetical protein|nr:MAG: hypothetical protein FD127_2453 [Acidimicrobiaceae bacterium]
MLVEHDEIIGQQAAKLGGVFMLDPDTILAGEALGLDLAAFYGLGRAGVLGDTSGEVAHATMYFFPRSMVVPAWARASAVMSPGQAVEHYAEACRAWGRKHLDGAAGLARICELVERVIGAADPSGRALFAGWAAVALPDDLPGRCAQVLHVLREMRGGSHIAAVMACGLTPLQAVLVDGGPDTAMMFGWPGPFPDATQFAALHAQAVVTTDRLTEHDLATLTAAERAELAGLLTALAEIAPTR